MTKIHSVKVDGAPSLEELRAKDQCPSPEELERRACVCIECVEEIPCNPCETSCPQGALTVGNPITNLPQINREKCSLCGLCVAACPGLAITIKSLKDHSAQIRFPWEFLPLPAVGDQVEMVNRLGSPVCPGTILAVANPARNDRTAVVTAQFSEEYVLEVVSIKRITLSED